MRGFSCLVILAGCHLMASAQDLSVKVTYSSVATRVDRELEAIGKQANVNLSTSPAMNQEILLIKVHDMVLSTLMAKIALATSGSWIKESNGYRLVVDPTARRQETITARLARIAKIDEQIKKIVAPIDKAPVLDPKNSTESHGSITLGTGGAGMTMDDHSPTGRALARMMRLLGASAFADIQGGDRVVWATNANRSQVPLPSGANGIIQTLVSEQRVVAQAAGKNKRVDNSPPEESEAAKQIQQMMGIDPEAMNRALDGPPAKVLLTAVRENIFGGLNLTLVLYDGNGKVLLTGRQTLSIGGGFMDMAEIEAMAKPTPPKAPNPGESKTIELSPLSKEMQALRGIGRMPGAMETKVPDDLKAIMLKPNERDPLSFAESEAVMALADAKKADVIANLPDALLQFSMSGDTSTTIKAFEERLKKSAALSEGPGFLLIKPLDPVDNRMNRVDRDALASFLQAVKGKEFTPLDDIARYALRNQEPTQTPGATTYLMFFAPDVLQSGMGGRADWNMLRLFATLPDSLRQGLARGDVLPLRNLTPEQEGYASRLLFGAGSHLQVEERGQKPAQSNIFEDALAQYKMPSDYRTEPTEAMPNGFPRGGTLTLTTSGEPVTKSTSQGMIGMAALGLDELAMLKFFQSQPQFAQMQAYMPNLNELRVGSRVIYRFKFRVAPTTTESQTLIDNSMPADAQTISMSNLPTDMQKMIDERIAMFKKLPFFSGAMFGRGTTPPP